MKKENIYKDYIQNNLFPKLSGDGGWVEFVSIENDELTLLFRGECAKCKILNRCIAWIESEIKSDIGDEVKIIAEKKLPYFQEK